MKPIVTLIGLLALFSSSLLGEINYYNSDNFTAQCNDELKSASPTHVYIENDSIFIKTTMYHQCCPAFELKVSENVNDLIMVQFTDTTSLQCDCMCHMNIIINVGKATSKQTKIHYLGTWYDLLTKDYSPLIETGKTWNSLSLTPDLEHTKPIRSKYVITSDEPRAFCWNAKFYHHVIAYNYGEEGEIEDTISYYIREESGKVYQVDPSGVSFDGCEEALIYDFTLDVGDTVTLGFDSIQFVVVPTDTPLSYGPRQWALAEVSAHEMSNYTIWIEGVGDTRGLFESSKSLQLDGVNNVLACCSLNDSLLYQDTRFPECGQRPAYQFFIEENKTWTSITHNTWNDSYSRNEISITADKMVGNPYAMVFYPNLNDKSYYIKETNGAVYQYEGDHNYLIYDFTLNVGDTVRVGNPYEWTLHLTVDSVIYCSYEDSILRKTLYLSGNGLMTWIEGIGEINSPLDYWQPAPTNGYSSSLACCSINGNTAYINPTYPDCGVYLGLSSTLNHQFSIYPNPASQGLRIIGDISADMRYQIITAIGQTAQSGMLTQDIDLNLPNGIYLFVVKEGNTVLGLEKLIVK